MIALASSARPFNTTRFTIFLVCSLESLKGADVAIVNRASGNEQSNPTIQWSLWGRVKVAVDWGGCNMTPVVWLGGGGGIL